jgi:hypothetical protein
LDCRRRNLRRATKKQNTWNRRIGDKNSTGFKGVCFRSDRGTYLAYITCDGRRIKLGTFSTAEEAAKRRDVAAIELHGEFAVLNFPLAKFDAVGEVA